jgi:hypothetical protein
VWACGVPPRDAHRTHPAHTASTHAMQRRRSALPCERCVAYVPAVERSAGRLCLRCVRGAALLCRVPVRVQRSGVHAHCTRAVCVSAVYTHTRTAEARRGQPLVSKLMQWAQRASHSTRTGGSSAMETAGPTHGASLPPSPSPPSHPLHKTPG